MVSFLRARNPEGLDSEALKIGPKSCPETSVADYGYSLRNIPEERSFLLLREESLKLRINYGIIQNSSLYLSSCIICTVFCTLQVIKSRRMRWTGHVARIRGEERCVQGAGGKT